MFNVKYYFWLIFSLGLTFSTTGIRAEPATGWQFSLAAGHGKITTPLAGRRSISGHFIPGISYYGERFYLENTYLGYALIERESGYIDLVGELNDDGMFFELDGVDKFGWWDALGLKLSDNTLPGTHYEDIERNLSYMAGISANYIFADTTFRLTVLQDISGVHHGETQRLSMRRDFNVLQQLTLRLSAMAERKDQQLINYYYNLRPSELDNKPSWFTLPAVWNFGFGASLNYQLNQDWSLLAHWQHHQLDAIFQQNPLFKRRDYQSSFAGVRYIF